MKLKYVIRDVGGMPYVFIGESSIEHEHLGKNYGDLVSAGFLQSALKDAALISSHIVLGCTDEKFFIKANSSKGNLNEELKQNKLEKH